jgi:hypothetical protein
MGDLNGHEAGNGGYSQGTLTANRDLLYSERGDVATAMRFLRVSAHFYEWQFE